LNNLKVKDMIFNLFRFGLLAVVYPSISCSARFVTDGRTFL
jgi:hypothetical protein